MSEKLRMGLIVAIDENGGIGKSGTIPWELRKDTVRVMRKTKTTEDPNKVSVQRNAVIMGRKCYDSIPPAFRPLKGRLNVVMSRDQPEVTEKYILIRNDLEKVMAELSSMVKSGEIERVWNFGGRDIYSWGLENDLVSTIEITKIQENFDADVKLPDVDWANFKEVWKSEEQEENGLKYTFHTYER
ncbi:hypothetical protein PMAYCL1PPCAC_26923, partial [Pristionchus mayeri]